MIRPENKWNGKETICATLRELHDRATELSKQDQAPEILIYVQEVHTLLDKAIQMAKRMDAKLRQYRADYDAAMWKEIGNG